MSGEPTTLGPTSAMPGLFVGDRRSIEVAPAVTGHFTAQGGRCAAEHPTDRPQRLAARQMSRYFFALSHGQG